MLIVGLNWPFRFDMNVLHIMRFLKQLMHLPTSIRDDQVFLCRSCLPGNSGWSGGGGEWGFKSPHYHSQTINPKNIFINLFTKKQQHSSQ